MPHLTLATGERSARPAIAHAGRAHLIGIGGAGMRALAQVLLASGWQLSGSDLQAADLEHLQAEGVAIASGHAAENLPDDADLVVHSLAIADDNPELRRAAELKIPCISYPALLGKQMSGRFGLAVAGTHGKSTTAAMAAAILDRACLDPTVVVGATPLGSASGGRLGGSKLMLAEACEFRRSFLHLRPKLAVVLGIELDHVDCYRSLVELKQAFTEFLSRMPQSGLVLANAECRNTQSVVRDAGCRVATLGFHAQAQWRAADLKMQRGRYRFSILHNDRLLTEVTLRVPGKHNVLNALAAAALASEVGARSNEIAEALSGFRGLERRLESLGTHQGISLYDDYAHHPTEVAATLATLRQMHPGRRLWCVFQPHQVSRTRQLMEEFAASLKGADKVAVADVFRAREPHDEQGALAARELAARARAGGLEVVGEHDLGDIGDRLAGELEAGDVLITIGAGDIRKVCDGVVDRLRTDRAAG